MSLPPESSPPADPASSSEGAAACLPPDPSIGTLRFDRYRIIRELGRGGMGVVLLAQDEELNMPVALKMLPTAVARDAEAIAGLKAEVLRGMALTHPGIVRVHQFERDAEGAAVVMEYVPGENLADLKVRERCFDCAQVRPWIEQIAQALDYAHGEARIAHRDMKPRNLMLTPEGRIKIADFGLASALSESLTRISLRQDSSGTPPYMSPQQAMGKPVTRSDDIYALGATVFELISGKPPFYRGDILAQLLHATPVTMTERRTDLQIENRAPIPASWERAVAACLAKESGDRPATVAAFIELLDAPCDVTPVVVPVVRVVRPTSTGREASTKSDSRSQSSRRSVPSINPVYPAVPVATKPSDAALEPVGWQSPAELQPTAPKSRATWPMKLCITLAAAALAAGLLRTLRDPVPSKSTTPNAASVAEAARSSPPTPGADSRLGGSSLQPAGALNSNGTKAR